MKRLAGELGTRLLVEEGEDVATVAAEVAAEQGTTYLIVGAPLPRRGIGRLKESLPDRLVRELPGLDIRIVGSPRGD